MSKPKNPKVSDELLTQYKALHPERKDVPVSMTRNETWVRGKISEFNQPATETIPPETVAPAPASNAPVENPPVAPVAPAPEEAEGVKEVVEVEQPAVPATPATKAPQVILPTSVMQGKKVEHKPQVMTGEMNETKKFLEKAPRVMFSIPIMEWEEEGAYETVTINGYRMVIQKGVMMELPLPVFQILAEKYKVEHSAGKDNRLDLNPEKNPDNAGNVNNHQPL